MTPLSRRDFVALAAAGAAVTPFTLTDGVASAALTAQEIVDRVKKSIGVDWSSDEVDTFKAGDPSTVVTGVVTTSMATLDVLQKAVKAGANLVITAAPTFYSRADLSTPASRGQVPGRGGAPGAAVPPPEPPVAVSAAPLQPDAVYAGKNDFIAKHKLVIFRLTENSNRRTPDPRAQGLATAMRWTKYRVGDDALRYDVPATTLEALAGQLKKNLGTRGSILSIGRVVNEAPGMQVCADWLNTIVSEVPIRFISAGDPYWRPI